MKSNSRKTGKRVSRSRFEQQDRKALYNMSTRKGAVEGLQWAQMRDTVHAQSGWTTADIQFERIRWRATKTELTWCDWLRSKRAEYERAGKVFLGPAR